MTHKLVTTELRLYSPKMLQQDLSLSFLILSFMFSHFSISTANSNNVYVQCSQLNFTSTTPYESNVNSLFTSLLDSASIYNFNKIETSPQSDSVYGVFQCRGDLSSPNCKDCVASSVSQLKTACPMSKGGEIQLERCFVKYEDTSFFGAQDKMEVYRRCGPSDGYNSDVSNRIDSALANLDGENEQYFRGGDFGSIQGVAQCVQDLSLSDCQDCLSEASGRLRSECETSTWGDMYLGKCYIRYAQQGNLNTPTDNSDPNSNKSSDKRRKKNTKWRNFGINVASFFGGALAFSLTVVGVFACSCCNTTNVYQEYQNSKREKRVAEKERDLARNEAKAAKEKAEKLEKELEEVKKECTSKKWASYLPPVPPPPPFLSMLPPCPYVPH